MRTLLISAIAVSALGCDYEGRDFVPTPRDDFPGIVVLNEGDDLGIITFEDWTEETQRLDQAIYHTLGPAEPGLWGGATATFQGTGGEVCVFVDPEAVFWNQSVSAQEPTAEYSYADNYLDDGDLDLEVGLSAYYTGSPGIEIGTFEQPYEDSLGNIITIEFNECTMVGRQSQTGAHAGRATAEYCTIDTSLHPDREYTIVLRTWSMPKDDYLLSYAVGVVDGPCNTSGVLNPGGVSNPECVFPGEARDEDGQPLDGFQALEAAYCAGTQHEFCADNPGLCG
ncbi:MAG: hypothetical protein H6739_23050 [Alphaproteobacteria bacterium]|nr:hypothetical protein [Alphaproteobacteria bacterium]